MRGASNTKRHAFTELRFDLHVEDGWPPVSVENVPATVKGNGWRITAPPLFVGSLSVGDVIAAVINDRGSVASYTHIERSENSTLWLLRTASPNNIHSVLAALRAKGCNTVRLEDFGCYSVDVPATVSASELDAVLSELDTDAAAVAYPSFRH